MENTLGPGRGEWRAHWHHIGVNRPGPTAMARIKCRGGQSRTLRLRGEGVAPVDGGPAPGTTAPR